MDATSKMVPDRIVKYPDYPHSPVKGWVFYAIVHYADTQIKKRIGEINQPILLTGLRVQYEFLLPGAEKPEVYVMQFGEELGEDSSNYDGESPLGEEFLSQLFHQVVQQLHANLTEKGEIGAPRLDVLTHAGMPGEIKRSRNSIMCLLCTEHVIHDGLVTEHKYSARRHRYMCDSNPCGDF